MSEIGQEQVRTHRHASLEQALHQAEHTERIAKASRKVLNVLAKETFTDSDVREVLTQIDEYLKEED